MVKQKVAWRLQNNHNRFGFDDWSRLERSAAIFILKRITFFRYGTGKTLYIKISVTAYYDK